MSDEKLMTQGAEGYPEWTDWLSNVEPQPMVRLEGYLSGQAFHPGHQQPHSHPHAYLQGAQELAKLPAAGMGSVYDPTNGQWVAVMNRAA
jgi:hypothetical protein